MKQTGQTILIFTAGLVLGAALVFGQGWYAQKRHYSAGKAPQFERLQGQYLYTNPLLECDLYPQISSTLTPFEDKLRTYISSALANGSVSDVSLYYRDLVNGPWVGINEKEVFSPASLLKVPLLMSIFKIADHNPTFLEQDIVFQKEQQSKRQQQIVPQQRLEVGKSYTINELLEHMIIYSDNDAANVLSYVIPQVELYKPYTELGILAPKIGSDDYELTVIQYASFLRVLYNATFLDREDSERALALLATTVYKDGLVAGLPENTRISHKFGERQWDDGREQQLHDCGIIYQPVRPYILCVMTRGKDQARMSEVIKTLSKITYNEVAVQVTE